MKSAVQQTFVYGSPSRQRGLAMVEFAIGLPVLLLLLMAMGELGRMLSQYNVLIQAGRDAARYAAHHILDRNTGQMSLDQVSTTSTNLAVFGHPGGSGESLLPGLGAGNVQIMTQGADHVRVTIRYRFVPVVGAAIPAFFGSGIPLGIDLVSSTVMRAL